MRKGNVTESDRENGDLVFLDRIGSGLGNKYTIYSCIFYKDDGDNIYLYLP